MLKCQQAHNILYSMAGFEDEYREGQSMIVIVIASVHVQSELDSVQACATTVCQWHQ